MEHEVDARVPAGHLACSGSAAPDQVFEIRVAGPVSDDLLHHLPGITLCSSEVRTVVTGRFQDQAELHGFLARLQSLRLDLVEVRRIEGPTDTSDDEEEA